MPETDADDATRRISLPTNEEPAQVDVASPNSAFFPPGEVEVPVGAPTAPVAPEAPSEREPRAWISSENAPEPEPDHDHPETVLYVPLAVTVGDGFKFGCGFFMALATMVLIGVLLVALLFLVTSFLGVTIPVGQ